MTFYIHERVVELSKGEYSFHTKYSFPDENGEIDIGEFTFSD